MKKFHALIAFAAAVICAGCMQIDCVVDEKFPPTENIRRYEKASAVDYEYKVIGICQTKGNYSEYSLDAMTKKIIACGEENGADAVIITGMRVVPSGRRVVADGMTSSIDATSAASTNTWEEINRDFDGGYGSIRNKNPSTVVAYDRIVRAELIRFVTDANGNLVKRSPLKVPEVKPLDSIKKIKAAQPETPPENIKKDK